MYENIIIFFPTTQFKMAAVENFWWWISWKKYLKKLLLMSKKVFYFFDVKYSTRSVLMNYYILFSTRILYYFEFTRPVVG